jgi:hypothetical protein
VQRGAAGCVKQPAVSASLMIVAVALDPDWSEAAVGRSGAHRCASSPDIQRTAPVGQDQPLSASFLHRGAGRRRGALVITNQAAGARSIGASGWGELFSDCDTSPAARLYSVRLPFSALYKTNEASKYKHRFAYHRNHPPRSSCRGAVLKETTAIMSRFTYARRGVC